MQGESRFESGAYTGVREHFEPAFNAAARRQGLSERPVEGSFERRDGTGSLAKSVRAVEYALMKAIAIPR